MSRIRPTTRTNLDVDRAARRPFPSKLQQKMSLCQGTKPYHCVGNNAVCLLSYGVCLQCLLCWNAHVKANAHLKVALKSLRLATIVFRVGMGRQNINGRVRPYVDVRF